MPATGNYILNAIGPSGPGGCNGVYHYVGATAACSLNDCCITNPIGNLTSEFWPFSQYDQVLSSEGFSLINVSSACPPSATSFCANPNCLELSVTSCDEISDFYFYLPYGAKIRMAFYVTGTENSVRSLFCYPAFRLKAYGINDTNRGILTNRGDCLNGWFDSCYGCEACTDAPFLSSLTGPAFGGFYYASFNYYSFDHAIDSLCSATDFCCDEATCFDGSTRAGTVVPVEGEDCLFQCEYNSCFEGGEPFYGSARIVVGGVKECAGYFDYECDVPCGVRIELEGLMPGAGYAGDCPFFVPGDQFSVEITCEKACPDV